MDLMSARPHRLGAFLGGLTLALSAAPACGTADDSDQDDPDPTAGQESDPAAGACLAGDPDCADIPTGEGGVTSGPDGAVSLFDLGDTAIDGPFVISAFVVVDDGGPRLCGALLESFPPQCGEPVLLLDDSADALATVTLTSEGRSPGRTHRWPWRARSSGTRSSPGDRAPPVIPPSPVSRYRIDRC